MQLAVFIYIEPLNMQLFLLNFFRNLCSLFSRMPLWNLYLQKNIGIAIIFKQQVIYTLLFPNGCRKCSKALSAYFIAIYKTGSIFLVQSVISRATYSTVLFSQDFLVFPLFLQSVLFLLFRNYMTVRASGWLVHTS